MMGTPPSPEPLFDDAGRAIPGASRSRRLWNGAPAVLAAPGARRWEFYTAMNRTGALNLTLAHIGFASFASVEAIDFARGVSRFTIDGSFDPTRAVLAEAPESPAWWRGAPFGMHSHEGERRVGVRWPRRWLRPHADVQIAFRRENSDDVVACVTPFPELPGGFFYEVKDPVLVPDGAGRVGDVALPFGEQDFAVLDWGRGVWPERVFWRWGAAGGFVGDTRVGLNLGDGFGDDAAGTESALVWGGRSHAIGRLSWEYDPRSETAPWRARSEDGRFEVELDPWHAQPVSVRLGRRGIAIAKVYGAVSGSLRTSASTLRFEALPGFIEDVSIRW